MKIEIHKNLGEPLVLECTRIVIYDNLGNPVAFALSNQIDPEGREHIRASHALDKDFEKQLHQNGISKTVVVERLDFQPKKQ